MRTATAFDDKPAKLDLDVKTELASVYVGKALMETKGLSFAKKIKEEHVKVIELISTYLYLDPTYMQELSLDSVMNNTQVKQWLELIDPDMLRETITYCNIYHLATKDTSDIVVGHEAFTKVFEAMYFQASKRFESEDRKFSVKLQKVRKSMEPNYVSFTTSVGDPENKLDNQDIFEAGKDLLDALGFVRSSLKGKYQSEILKLAVDSGLLSETYVQHTYDTLSILNTETLSSIEDDLLEISVFLYKFADFWLKCTFSYNITTRQPKEISSEGMNITSIKTILKMERDGVLGFEDVNRYLISFRDEGKFAPRHYDVLSEEDTFRVKQILG